MQTAGTNLHQLISRWRDEAEVLRRRAWSPGADLLESLAAELESALQATEAELLTLRQASEESGYSPEHLGRLVRQGTLRNYGEHGAPLVRRSELPRRPRTVAGCTVGPYDADADARALGSRRGGVQ